MKSVKIANDETVISKARLAQLEAKERSHDAYLWAAKRMADKARKRGQDNTIHGYNQEGYREALTDFSRLVVEAPMD